MRIINNVYCISYVLYSCNKNNEDEPSNKYISTIRSYPSLKPLTHNAFHLRDDNFKHQTGFR